MRFRKLQSFNAAALAATTSTLLRRPGLLLPHVSIKHVSRLDVDALRAAGVGGLVLDKDNTLTPPYLDAEPDADVAALLSRARAAFGDDKVVVLSNSAGSGDDVDFEAAAASEKALGLPVVRHPTAQKPKCPPELLEALDAPDLKHVAVVGDRVATDVLLANLHGAVSVHVRPISPRGDQPFAAACRWLENRVLLPVLRLCGARPPRHDALLDLVHTQEGAFQRWD
mmetsp:Transcript_7854/g.24746  ORF Transcript_7854/g.24746 Transcript_7854/m.24746 type:complete len:226 (-) Transcript_7854:26-703(-)